MDSTASKTISQDRASTYKARGKLGSSNRFVRAHQASVGRKASRMDNLTKRRRIPLSPIADKNQPTEETEDGTANVSEFKAEAVPSADPRREQLLKWREQQMLKKKMLGAQKAKRKSFVVRQIKHGQTPFFTMDKSAKVAKKPVLVKPAEFQQKPPEKRVTRASARLATTTAMAQDKGIKTVSKANTRSASADQSNAINKTTKAKVLEKKAEVVKESKKSTVIKPKSFAVQIDSKQRTQVKTRSQLKKEKSQETKRSSRKEIEVESAEPKEQEDKREAIETPPSFPQLQAIKGTVSVARGSTEGQSFAPNNFQFMAPSGAGSFLNTSKSFKFTPLSPTSAEKFMFGPSFSSSFSPVKPANDSQLEQQDCVKSGSGSGTEVFMEAVSQSVNGEPALQQNSEVSKEDPGTVEDCAKSGSGSRTEVFMEAVSQSVNGEPALQQNSEVSKEDPGTVEDTKTDQAEAVDTAAKSETKPEKMETVEKTDDHDTTHFRNLIISETERLNTACENWEKVTAEELELSEEVSGQIRTVIGQAQLLIAQRFHQFSGLIDLSQDKTVEKQATASDLQGFWEMIFFQVEDVNAKFEALSKLQQNGWKEETKVVTKGRKKTKAKKTKADAASKENAKPSGTRSRIKEMRAKMKAQKNKLQNGNENTTNGDAFVTILTPMTKRAKFDNSGFEVILTPVRRSIRKTPLKGHVLLNSPVVVTTPRRSTKHSPGLKLTPDPSTAQERGTPQVTHVVQSDDSTETTEESGVVSSESNADVEMKTDDKPRSAKGKRSSRKTNHRKSSGRVMFQQRTPGASTLSPALSGLAQTNDAEAHTLRTPSNRRLSRKCRARPPTPYSRVTMDTQEEPAPQTADSTTESDVDEPKGRREKPPLRRSARKTPKLRKRASFIAEKSGFLMYGLCPSTSDEDMPAAIPQELNFQGEGLEKTAKEDLETSPTGSNTCSERILLNPLTSRLRLKGTPKSILQHIKDLETPSPNSRQMTPVPKTTLFISPPGGENGAKPAPLLPLTSVIGVAPTQLTPCTQLARLTLSVTPLNLIDKRRDSVFFAPSSDSFKSAQENLMCFSPAVATAGNASNKHV